MYETDTMEIMDDLGCRRQSDQERYISSFYFGKSLSYNPFPNTPFWDNPKLKEAADINWNVAIKGF